MNSVVVLVNSQSHIKKDKMYGPDAVPEDLVQGLCFFAEHGGEKCAIGWSTAFLKKHGLDGTTAKKEEQVVNLRNMARVVGVLRREPEQKDHGEYVPVMTPSEDETEIVLAA